MAISPYAKWMLAQEARALLTRLARVKPFVLQESMLPAAGLLPASQTAIENFLTRGRRYLQQRVQLFLQWLESPQAILRDTEDAQRLFTMLRLRLNSVLEQFDLFDNVITQRSENETGVWLSGLDVVSADALQLTGRYYNAPPVICYLDRGVGAAIRRARTRLPGGGENPVAIIRVPRERMVGSGIASSLIHEVGHQAAALLNLVESLRPLLRGLRSGSPREYPAWQLWEENRREARDREGQRQRHPHGLGVDPMPWRCLLSSPKRASSRAPIRSTYLTELLRHSPELSRNARQWMPWNYRQNVAASVTTATA